MELVRDCLDKQLIDRNGRKMGRVDGIVMEFEKGAQPRIAYIEMGAVTQARRLNQRLAKWVARLSKDGRLIAATLSASRGQRLCSLALT